ncbi:hypothetical protein Ciccas_005672 [Cichlidogyrus casuarinus]|uniref:EF-hand domain-containing protein n=1 Tax=Cichlidogyrus casuarinus TaxID=1844966 RepID=A0ABD2Q809_9PLAT
MTAELSQSEIEDIREVFDLFDFWDGRDGEVDAAKIGDLLRCADHNPTIATCLKHGATEEQGQKAYKFEEFLPIYQGILREKELGTFADYMEAFKTFDREGQGYISMAELCHVLTAYGERLKDKDVNLILKLTETKEDLDGNIKFQDFIEKVMNKS